MGKHYSRQVRAGAGLAGLFLSWAGAAVAAPCADDTLQIRGDFGAARFSVVVAATPQEQARGLMYVESMPRLAGMLFVYETPRAVSFWMRNTLIPLDMVFIDEAGVVQHIHVMAQPLDETPIFGPESTQYVLEINGGMSDMLGLAAGDEVQQFRFGDAAIWPCEVN